MAEIRTDLAVEAAQLARVKDSKEIEGVIQQRSEPKEGMVVYSVEITTPEGEKRMGKPVGKYISMDLDDPFGRGETFLEETAKEFSGHIRSILDPVVQGDATVLIIGLGNRDVTPDSLGPLVTEKVLVTRHMKDDKVKPAAIIAIDALAARSLGRIAASVQVSNTGIRPGSGLGNRRKGLDQESMGVPVIAIGVPMVVYASTIVHDTVEQVLTDMQVGPEDAGSMLDFVHKKAVDEMGDMVVTPKEVDELVEKCAGVVADALNMALHEDITLEDARRFMS